jgi:hypothetical protein
MLWKAGAAASSQEAFDDLSGRSRAAPALLEFAPGRLHRRQQFRTPTLRQPMLEDFHEGLLFFYGQIPGGV